MIERIQRGIDFSKDCSSVESVRNENTVFHRGKNWYLKLDNDTEMLIPTRIGKVLYLGLKLIDTHIKSRGAIISKYKEDRRLPEIRFQSFDCYTFVSVGLDINKKELMEDSKLGFYLVDSIFKDVEHIKVEDYDQFVRLIDKKSEGLSIGIVSVRDIHNRLKHSFFVFISKEDVYIAEKAGFEGSILYGNSKDLIENILESHGHSMGVIFLKDYARD